jgi:putative hydrolase of HD superfamily
VDRIADFLFEVGMLKRTPRSGWQFLPGAAAESVAEHAFRTAMVAFTLARLDGSVNRARVVELALAHDLAEARTGDLNYMNQKYVRADEEAAIADLTRDLPFADELAGLLAEFRAGATPEAVLARDADQLELLLQLREQLDAGHGSASEWMPFALKRLRTDLARELGARIVERDSSGWWFDRGSDWWVNRGE